MRGGADASQSWQAGWNKRPNNLAGMDKAWRAWQAACVDLKTRAVLVRLALNFTAVDTANNDTREKVGKVICDCKLVTTGALVLHF